ncbi:MAG: 4-oxalocrotonate tautomerase family protein [Syntrophobacteraceae bacterium]|nr:4-oxalocrotonate tautomerase family protein [Syntrophobacteraceae bacterium]
MPFVNVKIAKTAGAPGATADQKAKIIKGVTQVLVDALGKDPETVLVAIEEMDSDNWGKGGESLTLRWAKAAQGAGR